MSDFIEEKGSYLKRYISRQVLRERQLLIWPNAEAACFLAFYPGFLFICSLDNNPFASSLRRWLVGVYLHTAIEAERDGASGLCSYILYLPQIFLVVFRIVHPWRETEHFTFRIPNSKRVSFFAFEGCRKHCNEYRNHSVPCLPPFLLSLSLSLSLSLLQR